MPHFPLLVILGNFVKRVLNHVLKSRLLQIYERARKHVQTDTWWKFKYTQYIHTSYKMLLPSSLIFFFFSVKNCFN